MGDVTAPQEHVRRVKDIIGETVLRLVECRRAGFEAVFRESQVAVMQTVNEHAGRPASPGGRVEAGIRGMFLAYEQPAARSLLLQAPAALGADRVRALDQELSLPMLEATIRSLASPSPAAPALAARLLFVALCEATTAVAEGAVGSN